MKRASSAKDGHDLHLHLAGAMRHVFRQGMELEVQVADDEDHRENENDHHDERGYRSGRAP